jgi:hypothetical protein
VPKQTGYLSFDKFPGNHCPTWIDISFTDAFGANLLPLIPPRVRRLKNKDPRIVKRYTASYLAYIHTHKLHDQAKLLSTSITHQIPLTPEQAKEANAIDCLCEIGMKEAEHKCQKLSMGQV